MAGAFVCQHQEGVWNAVLADQFGEQTYIRYGTSKGGLVGMTLSAEQVACRVLSFPLCQHVSHTFDVYINITTVLECAVPPSIIDEFGILRKVKAQLMKKILLSCRPSPPTQIT